MQDYPDETRLSWNLNWKKLWSVLNLKNKQTKTMTLITQLLSYLELALDPKSSIQLNVVFIQKSILVHCS